MFGYKYTAEDDSFTATFNITGEKDVQAISLKSVKLVDYVDCRYGAQRWTHIVTELCEQELDV